MYVYRSNLTCPDLRQAFPHAEPFVVGYDHEILRDLSIGTSGFISYDEAAILYHIALRTGGDWIEIGSLVGWSGAHILAAGVRSLLMVEPRLRERAFFERWHSNMERVKQHCGHHGIIQPFAGRTDQYSVCDDKDLFDGGFIDGDHVSPLPERDAQLILARLRPRGVIVFHDFGGPVKQAVEYLMGNGLSCRIYDTPQLIAVCWRGDFTPPDHVPDPAHASSFAYRRKTMGFDFSKCQ